MNSLSTVKYTAFVGLDWADAKHDICLQAAGSEQREFDCWEVDVKGLTNAAGAGTRKSGHRQAGCPDAQIESQPHLLSRCICTEQQALCAGDAGKARKS